MNEVWKDVKHYEGFYQVSNLGRVRSVDREVYAGNGKTRVANGKVLTPNDNGYGYLIVFLTKDGKRVNHYVHRLVAEAFVGEFSEHNVVNHIDYNTKNNRADNLEITTQEQNVRYSSHNMCHPKRTKVGKTGEKYICQRKRNGNVSYRVLIKQLNIEIHCKTLEEAIQKRGDVINGSEYFKQQAGLLHLQKDGGASLPSLANL